MSKICSNSLYRKILQSELFALFLLLLLFTPLFSYYLCMGYIFIYSMFVPVDLWLWYFLYSPCVTFVAFCSRLFFPVQTNIPDKRFNQKQRKSEWTNFHRLNQYERERFRNLWQNINIWNINLRYDSIHQFYSGMETKWSSCGVFRLVIHIQNWLCSNEMRNERRGGAVVERNIYVFHIHTFEWCVCAWYKFGNISSLEVCGTYRFV